MRALVCAIVKDEHRDLREWVDWHLALGFERIVLYDNDSSRPYQPMHGVEWRSWPGGEEQRQLHAYRHFAASEAWAEDDWCAFIDADEFVRIEEDSIEEFLSGYPGAGGIALSWRCFGADERIERPDLPVRQAYLKPVPLIRERHNFKSIVRLAEVDFFADVHRVVTKHRPLVRVNGEPVYGSEVPQTLKVAWLDHYITKSWEDYVARLKRGNITRGIRRIEHFFAYNPDMAHLAFELAAGLDFSEFPTLYDDRQLERFERLNHSFEVSARLDAIADGVVPDPVFHQACAMELVRLADWHLGHFAEGDRARLQPVFHALVNRQLAYLARIPRSFDGYYETIISNLISTPFERVGREAA